MTSSTAARRRMDCLVKHLSAEPDDLMQAPRFDANTIASNQVPSPQVKRRQAMATQVERLKEYGYTLAEEERDVAYEPDVTYATDAIQSTPISDDAAGMEAAAAKQLTSLIRAAYALGIVGGDCDDQVSLRASPGLFLVKPLGVRFAEVRESNLLSLSPRELADNYPMHHALYTARPEQRCVLSAANKDCELVACLQGEGLLPMCQDALRVYHRTRKADEDNFSSRISRSSHAQVQCWLVKNRGMLVSGDSPATCLGWSLFLARAAAFQVRALTAVAGDLTRLDVMGDSEAIRARQALEQRAPVKEVAERLMQAQLHPSR